MVTVGSLLKRKSQYLVFKVTCRQWKPAKIFLVGGNEPACLLHICFHALSLTNFGVYLSSCAFPGYEKYNTIRGDPTLCFLERVGKPDEKAIAAEQRNNDFMDG